MADQNNDGGVDADELGHLSDYHDADATDDDEPGPAVKHEPDEGGAALPKYESEEGEELMEIAARLSASHWIDAANIISPPAQWVQKMMDPALSYFCEIVIGYAWRANGQCHEVGFKRLSGKWCLVWCIGDGRFHDQPNRKEIHLYPKYLRFVGQKVGHRHHGLTDEMFCEFIWWRLKEVQMNNGDIPQTEVW